MATWLDKILRRSEIAQKKANPVNTILRKIAVGSLYKVSSIKGDSSLATIRTQIDTMRALAEDSQIATALSYYATDATTVNSAGQIIWATAVEPKYKEVAEFGTEVSETEERNHMFHIDIASVSSD